MTVIKSFKPCHVQFYPIVDHSDWLRKLLPYGVKFIQLRIKNATHHQLEQEIKRSVALAQEYRATLFVNDHWELAIHYGADGVHLGQEDLDTANIDKIHAAGMYLGISTHCQAEVLRAKTIQPSYIACGPIYSTTSKVMTFPPQGLAQLRHWRLTLDYPLVAIGGITLERLPAILKTGVKGVAVISAISKAHNPPAVVKQFLERIRTF